MASTPRRMNKSERQRPGGGADQIAQPTGRGSGAWRPASGHTARASARLAKTSSFRALVTQAAVKALNEAVRLGLPGAMSASRRRCGLFTPASPSWLSPCHCR